MNLTIPAGTDEMVGSARVRGSILPSYVSPAGNLFPVFCSWCLAAGFKHITRWEPYPNSSGMCLSHRIALSLESRFSEIRGEVELMKSMIGGE